MSKKLEVTLTIPGRLTTALTMMSNIDGRTVENEILWLIGAELLARDLISPGRLPRQSPAIHNEEGAMASGTTRNE